MSTEVLVTFALTVGLPVWLLVEELMSRLARRGPSAVQAPSRPAVSMDTTFPSRRAA
jgi:hypothetical protein